MRCAARQRKTFEWYDKVQREYATRGDSVKASFLDAALSDCYDAPMYIGGSPRRVRAIGEVVAGALEYSGVSRADLMRIVARAAKAGDLDARCVLVSCARAHAKYVHVCD